MQSDRAVQIYQNGHVTLLNPDPRAPPAAQFLRLAAAAEAEPGIDDEDRSCAIQGRVGRAAWALSRASGVTTAPVRYGDGPGAAVGFRNNTADRAAELETHRTPELGSWGAKEFFFLASSEQPDAGLLRGWLAAGFDVAVPAEPRGWDSPPAMAAERAAMLLPAEGPELAHKKFFYSYGEREFEDLAKAISAACQTYLRAGWSEGEVMERLALPAFRAASAPARPWGYNVAVGTVPLPPAALAAGPGGLLEVPVVMNLRYDRDEELYSSICCVVRRLDPELLGALPAGEPYPLVISAVLEGINEAEGEAERADAEAWELVRGFSTALADPLPSGPGEAEELAQELARSVLADDDSDYGLLWTQLAAESFCRAAHEMSPALGRIVERAREVAFRAAALKAVRPDSPLGAYEEYLAWAGAAE